MSSVFVITSDGNANPMSSLQAKDEDKELQRILMQNPNLLPGDQIDPDDPCRWLLIKREMPVPDPSSGTNRWSIDFLFVDQKGIPTFVECKRFKDTRSRREVIGQMLEYAANGHYYWTDDIIRDFAKEAAVKRGLTIEEALRSIDPEEEDEEIFFERVIGNLREGQVRLIFFLEEAPQELKSIVEFLNKQMERSEVLLVEAKLYTDGNIKVVVPKLFGYTEQARLIKKTVTVMGSGRKKWNKELFFEDVKTKLKEPEIESLKKIYEFGVSNGFEIIWGTGMQNGSMSLKLLSLNPRSLLTFWANGTFQINYGWIKGSPEAEKFRDELKDELAKRLSFKVPENYRDKFPSAPLSTLIPKLDLFLEIFGKLAKRNLT